MEKPVLLRCALALMWLALVLQIGLLLFGVLKEFDLRWAAPALFYQGMLVYFLMRTGAGDNRARNIFTALVLFHIFRVVAPTDWELIKGDIQQLTITLFPLVPLAMLRGRTVGKWFAAQSPTRLTRRRAKRRSA